jgi:uncharacterized protein (TIGR02145 family)
MKYFYITFAFLLAALTITAQDSVYIHRGNQVDIIALSSIDSVKIESLQINPLPETVTDIDGNVYGTIKIGNQVWMTENLRTTRFRNGDAIPTTATAEQNIILETDPVYQWPANNNLSTLEKYGRLYTWYAAADNRGLAPEGWRLPTQEDFENLQLYLIKNGYNYDGTTAANKVAKSLSAKTDWIPTTVEGLQSGPGTPPNNLQLNNTSGFKAYPAGARDHEGPFDMVGEFAGFFTSQTSNVSGSYAVSAQLYNTMIVLNISQTYKRYGLSVRCIKK